MRVGKMGIGEPLPSHQITFSRNIILSAVIIKELPVGTTIRTMYCSRYSYSMIQNNVRFACTIHMRSIVLYSR